MRVFNYASGVEISGGGSKVDNDGDGLIEIYTNERFKNMRHNLAGMSYQTSAASGKTDGCPASGCHGYELTANIDLLDLLDKNKNGMIDTTTVPVAGKNHTVIDTSQDTSWMPIGTGSPFTGTFEGNHYTIANLWVHSDFTSDVHAGLFGVTGGTTVTIRNVGILSGSIHVSASASGSVFVSSSGGLVGNADSSLTITNSYFSGEGISSASTGSISSFFWRSGW